MFIKSLGVFTLGFLLGVFLRPLVVALLLLAAVVFGRV